MIKVNMALVYVLRNTMKKDEFGVSKIFYVGMSTNDSDKRPRAHLSEAKRNGDGYNPYKTRTIRKITSSGYEVEIDIIEIGISKELATELEVFLVDFIGRRSEGKQLCNITKGGEGILVPYQKMI